MLAGTRWRVWSDAVLRPFLLAALVLLSLAPSAAAQDATVAMVGNVTYGSTLLTDPSGWTLYTWDGDSPGVSNCWDACSQVWAPYLSDVDPVAPSGLPGGLSLIDRGDGTWQVTYEEWPLYYFQGDTRPGDTNGDGSAGFGAQWYVVVVGAFAAPSPPPQSPAGLNVQPMPPAQPPAPVVQQPPAPPPVVAQPAPASTTPPFGAFAPGGQTGTQPGIYGPGYQTYGQQPYEGLGQGYPYPGPIPQSLTATAVASPAGTVSLYWQGSPIAASYRIYRATTFDPTNLTFVQSVPGSAPDTTTISGLAPGTSYVFQVRATDVSGVETAVPVSVSGTGVSGPTGPANLAVAASTGSSVTLSWTPIPGALNYSVRQSTGGGVFTNSLVTNLTSAGAVVTGLNPNTAYAFQVFGVDGLGNLSAPSNTVLANTTVSGGGLSPTGLQVGSQGQTNIALSWQALAGATSYVVTVSTNVAGPFGNVGAVTMTGPTSVVINGLLPNTQYYFRVQATDFLGNPSAPSAPVAGHTTL